MPPGRRFSQGPAVGVQRSEWSGSGQGTSERQNGLRLAGSPVGTAMTAVRSARSEPCRGVWGSACDISRERESESEMRRSFRLSRGREESVPSEPSREP